MSLLTAFYIIKRFLWDSCSWPDPNLSYYFIVFYKENGSITISDTSKERWAQYCKLFHDGVSDQNENPIWPKWRHLFFLFVFLMFVQLHLFFEIFWYNIGKELLIYLSFYDIRLKNYSYVYNAYDSTNCIEARSVTLMKGSFIPQCR